MIHAKNIIIVGGNAAGPAAAAKAKRILPDSNVLLFESGEFISTGTCELPYVLSGQIKDYHDIVFFTPSSFEQKKGVKVFAEHRVESIDKRNKKVYAKNLRNNSVLEYDYDKLILATGSKAVKLPSLPEHLENVFYLKSVADLLQIKNFIQNKHVKKVLVIGSGFIGLETAESFHSLGYEVTIIDKENLPMPPAEPEIQNLILEILKKKKINFYGGLANPKFIFTENTVSSIVLDGYKFEFDIILVAAGVKPNNSLAVSARLETGKSGGIKVDAKLKTSDPNIFAAGDCIEVVNRITNRNDYIPVATIAHATGHIAGANAAGSNLYTQPVVKNIAVKIFENSLSIVGLTLSEATIHGFKTNSVSAVAPNIITVMPGSEKVFGKIIFDKNSGLILGASFLGGREVTGYADLISSMIFNKSKAENLAAVDYNYTPPLSPFVNILSILGRKINESRI
ncbi:MAG: FAD-dependent oxidoreductase [bacterium]